MKVSFRLVIHETHARLNTTAEVADAVGASPDIIRSQVLDLNYRLKKMFGHDRDPIEVNMAGTWRVDGIAGILRLSDDVLIEVVPKFLDPNDTSWRTDFFFLAIFVRTGHILVADDISAGLGDRGDLASLVGRELIRLHSKNFRSPVREYRSLIFNDFSFDGDIDWDSLVLPESDGFTLRRLELTQRNRFNAVLKSALDLLIPEVGDGDTRALLLRYSHQIGPQLAPLKLPPRLPQRYQSWSPAYDLSQFVLEGMGLDLKDGEFTGLGFVVSTWSAWESLCEELIRRAASGARVVMQQPYHLGYRANGTEVFARPDIAVQRNDGYSFLFDAKYKTREGRKPSITSTDLYEGIAFLQAAKSTNIVLLYPALDSVSDLSLGGWKYFDEVRIEDFRIAAAQIQIRGLSRKGGFGCLLTSARKELERFSDPLQHSTPAT